jgi:hypothetical protein
MVQQFLSHKGRVTFGFMPQSMLMCVCMCICMSLSLAVFYHVHECGSFIVQKACIC